MARAGILLSTTLPVALLLGQAPAEAAERVDLATVDKAELYEGWHASELLMATVTGADGNETGEVRSILLDEAGRVTRLIVAAGGLLGIGQVHLAVPWSEVTIEADGERVATPIDPEKASAFSLFGNGAAAREDEWRVHDLLHDYVRLSDEPQFGIVQDLIFSKEGQLKAVLVDADIALGQPGSYGLPYQRQPQGRPGSGEPAYTLPYTRGEVERFGPFDRSALPSSG